MMSKKKKKIYLPKRLVARKGFSPSTLAAVINAGYRINVVDSVEVEWRLVSTALCQR